jgi:hypothetical protein
MALIRWFLSSLTILAPKQKINVKLQLMKKERGNVETVSTLRNEVFLRTDACRNQIPRPSSDPVCLSAAVVQIPRRAAPASSAGTRTR